MPTRSEFGGYAEATGGVLVEGLGVKVNGTLLAQPIDEAVKVGQAIGSGNLNEIGTTVVHVPLDMWNALVHAGPSGILAGLAIAGGLWLFGKGSIAVHDARRAAGH